MNEERKIMFKYFYMRLRNNFKYYQLQKLNTMWNASQFFVLVI